MAIKLHIDTWIKRADPDYYIMFIKAWIPFNAWYFSEYNTKRDDIALTQIKTTKNIIRNRIETMLTSTDKESLEFRNSLAALHNELEKRKIMNYQHLISFSHIRLDEYFPSIATDIMNDVIYKITPDKTNGFKILIISKDEVTTYMSKTLNPNYSLNNLDLENQYISLPSQEMKNKIREMYISVDPKLPFSLIEANHANGIKLENYNEIYFKNDSELIAKSLIQILYELRCILFHGILNPNETYSLTYKYAFEILSILIKELK